MKPIRFLLSATSLAMLGMFSSSVLAHAEHDKPRYVATKGVDKGACDTIEAPCLTFSYAANQSNKGDQILVAGGQYVISDPDSLFYLLSQIIPVKAGFSQADGFKQRDEKNNITSLIGVPLDYADQLRAKGFVVNTDQKYLSEKASAQLKDKLSSYESLAKSQSDVPCVDGKAGQYSCSNIDLLAHVPLSEFGLSSVGANDIWGYIDLNTGKEYAMIGLRNGVSLVDVSTPTVPVVVGSIQAQSTIWRDIKIYQHYSQTQLRWKSYAYVTADGASEGLWVISLNDLANGISVTNVDRSDTSAHNVFLSNVDYSTGVAKTGASPYLHIAGSNNLSGAFNTYSLLNPTGISPVYKPSSSNNPGYTHDVSAMIIDDDRVGDQCTGVNGQCEIFFDYNVKEIKIWDKTNNSTPDWMSDITYSQATYVHSGWTTEDGKVVLVHDELDESNHNLNTTVRLYNISDLRNPQPLSVWTGPTGAIDHNGFVRGNRYYMSNYQRGLTVLDLTDPSAPIQAGYFDTFPVSDNTGFSGAWGVYPFLPSGNILVSDVNSGLYVLGDRTVGNSGGTSVKFDASSYEVDEGGTATVTVSRSGNKTNAVTVQYETHIGSADSNDFTMVNGTLSWADGDTTDQKITIATNVDSLDEEYDETLFVRLYNPTDGLSLASPSISMVNIDGLELPTYAGFTNEILEVKEIDGAIMIPVNRSGDFSNALSIGYELMSGSATLASDFEFTPGTLTWAAGESDVKQIALTLVNDSEAESTENLVLKLTQDDTTGIQEITVMVRDDDSNQAPQVTVTEDFTVEAGASISLSATASDPEGYPLSYQWIANIGSIQMPMGTSSGVLTNAPDEAGTMVFNLTVTDDFGLTTSATVTVTVNGPTTTPDPDPTTPTPTPAPTPTASSGGGGATWFLPMFALLMMFRRKKR